MLHEIGINGGGAKAKRKKKRRRFNKPLAAASAESEVTEPSLKIPGGSQSSRYRSPQFVMKSVAGVVVVVVVVVVRVAVVAMDAGW